MAKKHDYFKEYVQRTKKNELHFEKVETDKLIELTRSMTSVCFLGRPECNRCPLSGEPLYCPPAAAKQVLMARGYERIEVTEGLTTRIEYSRNPIQVELVATV